MTYCVNCGNQHENDDKFCKNCGTKTVSNKGNSPTRQQEYSGVINKCPSCGEVLSGLVATCPACGYELRGTRASESIHEFALKVEQVASEDQKSNLIRTFPIPNSKEDIFEFMIMALSNLSNESRISLINAWTVKIEQSYLKAKLIFSNDNDFSKFQAIYDQLQEKVNKENKEEKTKKLILMICCNAGVIFGIALYIWALVIDVNKLSAPIASSFYQFIGSILLIASAATLRKRNATYIEYLIGGISGILLFVFSGFYFVGIMAVLVGATILILVVINLIKKHTRKNKESLKQ